MSVKRIKDPAGLLPDQVSVDLTEPTPDDASAVGEILEAATPQARIDRLRRHDMLSGTADHLSARLYELNGTMDARLDAKIKHEEFRALYLDAAPAAIETNRRNIKKLKHTNSEIDAALKEHDGNRKQAAESLDPPMHPRSIRRRIQKEQELGHWRKSQDVR